MIAVCAVVVAQVAAHSPQGSQLGTVHFPTSAAPEVQPSIERGVALLHSFQYLEAAQAFDDAARRDTSCAVCHWGQAMALYHQLWDWPNAETIERGRREVAEAQRVGVPTPRERGYLAAAAAFFNPPIAVSQASRLRAYSRAMASLHRQFADDGEATAFYALSLIALANANIDSDANRRRAIDLLTPLFQRQPNHPGAAHYLIHATDRPGLARFGVEAAKMYADIAPDSSHALHMPSHIFVRLGMWPETVQTNLRAAAAGKQAALEGRGDYTYQVHALDYVQYAYLQLGKSDLARAVVDEFDDVPTASEKEKASDRAYAAARAALEEHRWADAASLPIPSMDVSWFQEAYLARLIGAARIGDAHAARANWIKYYESTRESHRTTLNVEQLEANAWVAYAERDTNRAINSLRRAARLEAGQGGDEIAMPAREMLADMLLELRRPADALQAYRLVLRSAPNRFDALLGAARAADARHLTRDARRYYRELLRVAAPDADRSELQVAREYLAKFD